MLLCNVLVRCGAVCVVIIALQRFDVSIDTDASANYKCGHCGWIELNTVPEDCTEPDW